MNTTIKKHLQQIRTEIISIHDQEGLTVIQRAYIITISKQLDAIRQELTAQAKPNQTEQTEHEGWSNYETWLCWKWIKSQDHESNSSLTTAWSLINTPDTVDLKGWLQMQSPLAFDNDVHANLLQSAIDRIDFTEIAERLISEAREDSGQGECDGEDPPVREHVHN